MSDTQNPEIPRTVAFLGPHGTFGDEALRTLPEIDQLTPIPARTMPEALHALNAGEVDLAFVAIENSIEGTVTETLDSLIFDTDLYIQREVVIPVQLCLAAPAGVKMKDVRRVISFPVAAAQCRDFMTEHLAHAETVASNSTSDAMRQVSRTTSRNTAAVGTRLAAELYGLNVLAEDVSDHDDNQTRFVLVSSQGIPAPTGHDRTSIVIFQSADKPGNLHSILGQFSARNINLTKLESRPTKKSLGDYCFVVDLEGHIDDEVIADCLRDMHVQAHTVKFLGSYPAAGAKATRRRRDAQAAWRTADEWVRDLRKQVAPAPKRGRLKVVR